MNPRHTFRILVMLGLTVFFAPGAKAQWEYFGSAERCRALDFAWDDVYHYFATDGRIYYSNDHGVTWHLIPDNDFFIAPYSIRGVDGKLYAEVKTKERPRELFVSTDHGATWERITMMAGYTHDFHDFVVRNDTMIMRVAQWMFHSYDGGKTRGLLFNAPGGMPRFDRIYWTGPALVGVPATGGSYWRSTDLGVSWTEFAGNESHRITEHNGILWRAIQKSNDDLDISVSTDGGLTWTIKTTFPQLSNDFAALVVEGDTIVFVNTSSNKVAYSTDSGDTWQTRNSNNGVYYIYKLFGGTLFSTADWGVTYSHDLDATWQQHAYGITDDRVYDVILPGNDVVFVESIKPAYSTDGFQWHDPDTDIGSAATDGNGRMVGVSGKSVYHSSDYGATWTFHQNINVTFSNTYASDIKYFNGNFYIFFTGGKMTMSTDGGQTWSTPVNCPGSMQQIGYNDGKFFGHDFNNNVFLSDDAIAWQNITYNLNELDPFFNPQYYGLIYTDSTVLLHAGTLCRLKVGEQVWEYAPYVSNDSVLYLYNYPQVRHIKQIDNILVAACDGLGVFISYDTGYSWTPFNDGLLNLRAGSIASDGQHIYAGMYNGGTWRRPLADLHHYNIISGSVFFDENQNGVQDTLEIYQPGITVQAKVGKTFVNTKADGQFTLYTNTAGPDTIDIRKPIPSAVITTPAIEVQGSMDSLKFGVHFDNAVNAAIDITPLTIARPGFEFELQISVENKGQFPTDMHVVLMPDSLTEFIISEITPIAMNGDSLEWQLDKVPGLTTRRFTCSFYLPPDVLPQTPLQFTATVRTIEVDAEPGNNQSILHLIAMGAFDPNEKLVHPVDAIPIQSIRDTATLTYTILFQNKGNYQADNVRLIDTLSPLLDINSFRMMASSHNCEWQIRHGNILEVKFDNIYLPYESTDEPGSHGFFKYEISPLASLSLQDEITNTAQIYFDFNPPIVTNQTRTTIQEFSVAVNPVLQTNSTCELHVHPNPVNDWLDVDISRISNEQLTLRLCNMNGRILSNKFSTRQDQITIDLRQFSPGMYQLIVSDATTSCSELIVKTK